jgi:hypothetical protein
MSIDVKWILSLMIVISAVSYYAGFVTPQGPFSYKAKAAQIGSGLDL